MAEPASFEDREAVRNLSRAERDEINRIGRKYGCHTCGTRDPGTTSGDFIVDLQLPARFADGPKRLYPHCLHCTRIQGGGVLRFLRERR